MLKSLISAFLMYSRIPMPKVEWSEKNRRFSLCFFPLVGGVIGVFFLIWQLICDRVGIGLLLRGAVAAAIPIMITGGIHLDGFCDVSDAMASWGDKARRLEIMKDSHIGAFAVIRMVLYFALEIAVYSESNGKAAAIIAVGFVLSRCLSGIAAVTFKSAKNEGSLYAFVNPAHRTITRISLAISAFCCMAAMLFISPTGLFTIVVAFAFFVYYRHFSYKNFGGITGDLAGWFLQICELLTAFSAVIILKITEVL